MARPRKCRRVCYKPQTMLFYPDGGESTECISLTLDEYEVHPPH